MFPSWAALLHRVILMQTGTRRVGLWMATLAFVLPGCFASGNDGGQTEAAIPTTSSLSDSDNDERTDEASLVASSCSDPIGDLTVDGGVAADRGGLDVTSVNLVPDDNGVVAELMLAAEPATAIVAASDSAIWYLSVTVDPAKVGFRIQAGLTEDGPAFEVVDLSTLEYSEITGTIEEDKIRLELPQHLVGQLGAAFFWHAGTEGNPEDGRQYQDACPGLGGVPEKYLRFQGA